jgi:hypothetical protein
MSIPGPVTAAAVAVALPTPAAKGITGTVTGR